MRDRGQARESLALLILLAAGLALSVVIDKQTYGQGETVYVNITDYNNTVNVNITFPNGTVFWTGNLTTNATSTAAGVNNSYPITLPIAAGTPNGTWNLTAYNVSGPAANVSLLFNVTAYYSAPTVSVNTTTATVARTNTTYFQVNITNNGNVNDTFYLNHTCDANFNCTFNQSSIANLLPNQTFIIVFSAYANATATFTSHSVLISANFSSNNTVNASRMLTLTVPEWYGANLTVNTTQYVRRGVWEPNTFVVQLNNTGSNGTDNFWLNITAGSWNVSVDGDNVTAGLSRDKNYMAVSGNSNRSILVNVTVPSTAQMGESASVTLFVKSFGDATKNQSVVITLKRPVFNISTILTFNNNTNNFTVNVSNAVREGADSVSFSSLNFSVYNSTGLVNTTAGITVGSVYSLNATNWTSASNYYISLIFIDSANYSDNYTAYFRTARSTRVALSSSVTAISAGNSFTFTTTSTYDNGDGAPWTLGPTGGISCSPTTGNASGSSSCNVSSTASTGSYTTTLSQAISNCLVTTRANTSCTFSVSLANSTSVAINVTATTTTTTTTTTNQTTTTTTTTTSYQVGTLNLTQFPTATSATPGVNSTLTVKIKNTNTTNETNLTTNVDEKGDIMHFDLLYTNISTISANTEADFTITVAPLKYVRPGEYTVQVFINNEPFNITVTVPAPTDEKTVRRYVDVKKDRSQSTVALLAKNAKNYTARLNITETIPKEAAADISEVSFVTNYSKVIEADPVVLFEVDMAAGEQKELQYSVTKDLSKIDFTEPEVAETKKIVAPTTVSDIFSDPVFLTIIVAALIGISLAVIYFYVLRKPKTAAAPFKFEPPAPTPPPTLAEPKKSPFAKLAGLARLFKRKPPGPPPTPWRED